MPVDRERITLALYERLQASVAGVTTWTRRSRLFSDVASEQQPLVALVKVTETAQPGDRGLPTKVTLRFRLEVLTFAPDPAATPEYNQREQNRILTAIEKGLERLPTEMVPGGAMFAAGAAYNTTLGGLCSHCRISGDVENDEGALGEQGTMLIPIEILVTS